MNQRDQNMRDLSMAGWARGVQTPRIWGQESWIWRNHRQRHRECREWVPEAWIWARQGDTGQVCPSHDLTHHLHPLLGTSTPLPPQSPTACHLHPQSIGHSTCLTHSWTPINHWMPDESFRISFCISIYFICWIPFFYFGKIYIYLNCYWIQVQTQTWTYWTWFKRFWVQVHESAGLNPIVKVWVWLKSAQTWTKLDCSQYIPEGQQSMTREECGIVDGVQMDPKGWPHFLWHASSPWQWLIYMQAVSAACTGTEMLRNLGMGRYAVSVKAWEVAFIHTPVSMLARDSRTRCISWLPLPIVRGVLSDAPMIPSRTFSSGRLC